MFDVKIVTPNEVAYEGKAESLIAPGELGSFGVLSNHAPFITTLVPGKLTLREASGQSKDLRIEGGFFEVSKNRAIVLTDKVTAEKF